MTITGNLSVMDVLEKIENHEELIEKITELAQSSDIEDIHVTKDGINIGKVNTGDSEISKEHVVISNLSESSLFSFVNQFLAEVNVDKFSATSKTIGFKDCKVVIHCSLFVHPTFYIRFFEKNSLETKIQEAKNIEINRLYIPTEEERIEQQGKFLEVSGSLGIMTEGHPFERVQEAFKETTQPIAEITTK